ncbi:MAG: phosphoadenosine phosphosulfate reductase [Aliishimia sp.]
MQDTPNTFAEPLAGLNKADWISKLEEISEEHGYFERLGSNHFAALVEDRSVLLVTFETLQGIRALDEDAQPLGWELVKSVGWSHLALISNGDTWFRDDSVYAYFDRLVDDGFFDSFEKVVFYGAGPCGYAAAAFSVVAPGATVIAIQPQATLNPEVTGWDERFVDERRLDFTSRYGYAPDMLEAASNAFILYDPFYTLDSMHAALFTRPNVTKLQMRHMGDTLQTHLLEMQLVYRMIAQAGAGKLSRTSFAKLLRARRDYAPYLRHVMATLDRDGRDALTMMLCENVTSRMNAPKFSRRLKELQDEYAAVQD